MRRPEHLSGIGIGDVEGVYPSEDDDGARTRPAGVIARGTVKCGDGDR